MVLAIDFDGVIHDPNNVKPGYKMGLPIDGAKAALDGLAQHHKIIIHTIWATDETKRTAIASWLDYFKIPFDQVTATKPKADYYIDDKAIHFDTWENVLTFL